MKSVSHPPDISIVIPALNEALRLPKTILLLQEFLTTFPHRVEMIPVIQGEDLTANLISKIALSDQRLRPIYQTNGKGKGNAVRQGVAASQGKIILFMDADLSVPLSSLDKLVVEFIENPNIDILIGSRLHPQSHIITPQPWRRYFLGRFFNLILKLMGLTKLDDTQCGCKLFRHDVAKKIFPQGKVGGFGFDVELLLIAEHFGYKIKEAPVEWGNEKNSRFRMFWDGLTTIREIWCLKNTQFLSHEI